MSEDNPQGGMLDQLGEAAGDAAAGAAQLGQNAKDAATDALGAVHDSYAYNTQPGKDLRSWIKEHHGVSQAEIDTLLNEGNKFTREVYEQTYDAVSQQIENKAGPLYEALLMAQSMNMMDDGASTIAYAVASSARDANQSASQRMDYFWDAFNRVKTDEGWGAALMALASTAFTFVTNLFRSEENQQSDKLTSLATSIAMEKVSEEAREYLQSEKGLGRIGALTIAKTVYDEGMKAANAKDTRAPFQERLDQARKEEFIGGNRAEIEETVTAQASDSFQMRMDEMHSRIASAGTEAEKQAIREEYELSWTQSNVLGKSEFDVPELIFADRNALGIAPDKRAAFNTALTLTKDPVDIAAMLTHYIDGIQPDDFKVDKYGTLMVTIKEQDYYLDKTGISAQDAREIGEGAISMVPFVRVARGFHWMARAGMAAAAGGTVSLTADQLAKMYDGGSDTYIGEAVMQGIESGGGVAGVHALAAVKHGGKELLGKLTKSWVNAEPLNPLDEVRMAMHLERAGSKISLQQLREMAVDVVAQNRLKTAGVAVAGGLMLENTVQANAKENAGKEVEGTEPLKPGATPVNPSLNELNNGHNIAP